MTRLTFAVIVFIFTLGYTVANPLKAVQPVDGCACEKFSCGCCLYMDVPQIWLNDTVCVNFAYLPDSYGISFTVTIDDKSLINETISARNPPPICFPVPYLEDFIDGCIHFTDLDIKNSDFHGCVQLEIRMWWIYVIEELKLGCFDTYCPPVPPVFPNVTVDDTYYKYNLVPMQDMMPIHEIKNVTKVLNEYVYVNATHTTVKLLNHVAEVKEKTEVFVPFNQSLELNQYNGNNTMEGKDLSMCSNVSNPIHFSSYLLLFIVMVLVPAVNVKWLI